MAPKVADIMIAEGFVAGFVEVSLAATSESLRHVACHLAEDFVNQFGILRLNTLQREA